MRTVFRLVGRQGRDELPAVEMDALPAVGDTVHLPPPAGRDGGDGDPVTVRTVVFYPWGTAEDPGPFAYIVIGDRR